MTAAATKRERERERESELRAADPREEVENCHCNKRDSVRSESLSPGKEAAGTVWLRQSWEVLLFILQLCSQAMVHSPCSLPAALGVVVVASL